MPHERLVSIRDRMVRSTVLVTSFFSYHISPRTWLAQNSSAPQLPLRSTCSAAHSASLLRVLRSQTSCEGGRPSAASASACGGCGGCSSTMRREAAATRAGRSRRISPMPGCCSSKSTRVPTGQPPPGNCFDSTGWPVSTQRVFARASCEASHSEGCNSSGEVLFCKEDMITGNAKVLDGYTVLARSAFGKMCIVCLCRISPCSCVRSGGPPLFSLARQVIRAASKDEIMAVYLLIA